MRARTARSRVSATTEHAGVSLPAEPAVLTPITEAQAAEAMWAYYREHKATLIADIKDYRAGILARLQAGERASDVFAPYRRKST